MKFTFSPHHQLLAPEKIVVRGTPVRNLESPARAEALLSTLLAQGHEKLAPQGWDRRWISAVHDLGYLGFLEAAYAHWQTLPNASRLIHPYALGTKAPVSVRKAFRGRSVIALRAAEGRLQKVPGRRRWARLMRHLKPGAWYCKASGRVTRCVVLRGTTPTAISVASVTSTMWRWLPGRETGRKPERLS